MPEEQEISTTSNQEINQEINQEQQVESQPSAIKNPDSYNKALEQERKARKELEKKLKDLEGVEPKKYQELLAAEAKRQQQEAEAERQKLEAKGAYEALTAKQRQEHERAIAAINEQLAAATKLADDLKKQISDKDSALKERDLRDATLEAFLSANGRKSHFQKHAWRDLKDRVLATEDGNIQLLNEAGRAVVTKDGSPDWDAFMASYRDGDGGIFFEPTKKAEGGGMTSGSSKGTLTEEKSITREQAADPRYLRANGISIEDIAIGKVKIK